MHHPHNTLRSRPDSPAANWILRSGIVRLYPAVRGTSALAHRNLGLFVRYSGADTKVGLAYSLELRACGSPTTTDDTVAHRPAGTSALAHRTLKSCTRAHIERDLIKLFGYGA